MYHEIKGDLTVDGQKFALVVSRFNEFITSKLESGCWPPGAVTQLVGAPESMVLKTSLVSIGSLTSKIIVAEFVISVPVGRSGLALIVNVTCPSPSCTSGSFGGSKPIRE